MWLILQPCTPTTPTDKKIKIIQAGKIRSQHSTMEFTIPAVHPQSLSQQLTSYIWNTMSQGNGTTYRPMSSDTQSTRYRTRPYRRVLSRTRGEYTAPLSGLKQSRLHGVELGSRLGYQNTSSVLRHHERAEVPH